MTDPPKGRDWRRVVVRAAAIVGPPSRRLATAVSRGSGRLLARHLDGGFCPAPAPSETSDIVVENLRVAYAGGPALDDVTGRFAPGSLTAIVGPNGAGKSTLLKALAGLVRPRSGRVACTARTERRIAYLPQQAAVDRDYPMDVGDFIAMGGWREFGGFRRLQDVVADRAVVVAGEVGLEDALGRPIANLSVGEFQRALFARLLMQDAGVVLLDEPFTAIDEQATEDLLRIVRRMHTEGRTVIAVLHDLDQVRTHFPAVVLLARTCVGWGDTATVLTPENLARARELVGRTANSGAKAAA